MASRRVSSVMALPPFQALIDDHGRDLLRYLTATVGTGAAEDCYQETWIAALRGYPRLAHAGNLRSWLFTIAHRKALDHLRAHRRRPVVAGFTEDVHAAGAPDPQAAPAPEAESDLWVRVAALPDKQRTAIALRFMLDAPHAEIAAVMGISEEAARRNLHEGLKRLRTEYARD